MSNRKEENPDIFVANRVYPDAKGIFYKGYESLEEVRDQCIVVLDTNALLVPYGISKNSLTKIASTYRYLANASRLIIPGQVAREFANNRPIKIAEIFQALNRRRNNISNPTRVNYPLLEDIEEYSKVQDLENKISNVVKEYQAAVGELIGYVKSWNWDDPVSQLYSEIFPTIVVDIPLDKEDVINTIRYQKENKLPPGYKDAAKDDWGIGDHLVWKVVVHIAKELKQPVVLVSDDSKADWFHRSEKQPLFPRFELVDEIRRVSEGKSLHIISFSRFLELFGSTDEVVKEVRKEETKINHHIDSSSYRRYVRKYYVGKAVAEWLRTKYPHAEVNRESRFGDFAWTEWGGASTLILIEYFEDKARVNASKTRHEKV